MKFRDLPHHHAVLLVDSNRNDVGQELFNELKTLSPVHSFFNQTVLSIEHARKIISWANIPNNEEKIALISFHTIGLEAQNALLKVLEEPRKGVRFILLTSNKTNLIDTVLSRVQHVSFDNQKESLTNAVLFLKTKHTMRMKLSFVTDLLSRIDEEERKDKESIRAFVLALSSAASQEKIPPSYIKEIVEVASYVSMPSSSGKALLEYLALLLPQTAV